MCVVRLPRNRIARTLLLLVALPAFVGGVLGLGLAAAFRVGGVSADGPVHELRFTRTRLKPIPVPQRACPYLDAVRTTAAAAGSASLSLFDARPSKQAQGGFGTDYPAKLAAFDLSLRVAATQVPAPLRSKLTVVAVNVEIGRKLLEIAPDERTYSRRSFESLVDGVYALQDASDLTGTACGFQLSAGYLP
jgi:hypothetical protein